MEVGHNVHASCECNLRHTRPHILWSIFVLSQLYFLISTNANKLHNVMHIGGWTVTVVLAQWSEHMRLKLRGPAWVQYLALLVAGG